MVYVRLVCDWWIVLFSETTLQIEIMYLWLILNNEL